MERLKERLDNLGIRPERLQLEWISAAEGLRFQKVMGEMERIRQTVTPEEIAHTQKILKQKKKKRVG